MNERAVDGVRYVAREAEDCTGCAGDGSGSLCRALPLCAPHIDGRYVIWVRADDTEKESEK